MVWRLMDHKGPTKYKTLAQNPTTSTLFIQSCFSVSSQHPLQIAKLSIPLQQNPLKFSSFKQLSLLLGAIFFFLSMPGTIQISVLDFMGLPSSYPPSSISIKVSIGKREYQTWDRGDFSFPLTTLHENLVVTLQDAEGNEISHTGVDIMSIVERGSWDDLFPLEGGGHVHMKLQFTLSGEERNRIRIMRETALKRKQMGLLSSSVTSSETASDAGSSAASSPRHNNDVSDLQKRFSELVNTGEVATRADPPPKPDSFFKDLPSGSGNREGTSLYQKQTTPNDTDASQRTSSTAPVSQGVEVYRGLTEKIQTLLPHADVPLGTISSQKASSMLQFSDSAIAAKYSSVSPKLEDDRADKIEQGPMERTPSIRQMISAFENSLAQDMKPHIKPPVVKSQSKRVGREGPLKGVYNPAQLSSERLKNPFITGEMQQTHINIMKRGHIGFNRDSDGTKSSHHTRQLKESSTIQIQSKGTNSSLKNKFIAHEDRDTKEERKSPEILTGTSATETATISGRMFDEHSSGHKPYVLFTDQQDSGNISMGSRRQIHSKDSQDIDIRGASNDELKSVAYCEDENNYFQSSGAWIFPDEARRLCITTASKQVMDLMGSCSISVPENARKRGTDVELKRGEKTFHKPRKSRPESSADVASTGLVEQAIKIAIMVGFGALVLFTRQRKPRKSSTDGNNSFFTIPDYMDQQILTEEEMD